MHADPYGQRSVTLNALNGIGLVLSGGGAKGAYQAGVLRALDDMHVQIGAISGASIGALNGAIVAAAPTQSAAANHLQELWTELAGVSPIQIGRGSLRIPAYLVMLSSFGAPLVGWTGRVASSPAFRAVLAAAGVPLSGKLLSDEGWLSNQRVRQLIDRYVPDGELPQRLPLYVSVYPTESVSQDLMRLIGASWGVGDTKDSDFLHIQSLPGAEQKKALLASAALPLLYAAEEIKGQRYTDGGQGGWRNVQGNTPISPLLEAGCRHVVVTHLEDGSFWNRHQFPNATVIEIRPAGKGISRKGGVRDVLGFNNELIPSWMEQGYEDTLACVSRIKDTLDAHNELADATKSMKASHNQTGRQELAEAMRRLDDGAI